MKTAAILISIALMVVQAKVPHWTQQTSGVTARLRGVSAVTERVAWASGANGTIVRTADGGSTWQRLTIPDTSDLDFRDIDAVSDRVAYVLSIGPGSASRIYKTTDAGAIWRLQFTNEDPKAFYDAMTFCNADRGFAVSDSVDGRFVILHTVDGGAHWSRVSQQSLPAALPDEGAFAASGSNIAMTDCDHAWIGTGSAPRARVLRTADGGATWSVADTPLASGTSSGIFSVAFRDERHGLIVGGDYKKENEAVGNAAATDDWCDMAGSLWARRIPIGDRACSGDRGIVDRGGSVRSGHIDGRRKDVDGCRRWRFSRLHLHTARDDRLGRRRRRSNREAGLVMTNGRRGGLT